MEIVFLGGVLLTIAILGSSLREKRREIDLILYKMNHLRCAIAKVADAYDEKGASEINRGVLDSWISTLEFLEKSHGHKKKEDAT